jgi:ribonuclease VapC
VSAANFLEAAIVVDVKRRPIASRRLDDLLDELDVVIEPVTEEQARIARTAYRDYGRGSGHPAQLNFGDCFAYALARATGEPLLFKGNDFAHTDITPALEPPR